MRRLRNGLLLGLLAVCALSFWMAHRTSPPQQAPSAAARVSFPADLPAKAIHLAVLNGTMEPGLARRYSRELPSLGCVVVAVGDAPHDSFAVSLLVNRRLTAAVARDLSARLNGVPLLREWDSRAQEDAVLVLGRDHLRLPSRTTAQP